MIENEEYCITLTDIEKINSVTLLSQNAVMAFKPQYNTV